MKSFIQLIYMFIIAIVARIRERYYSRERIKRIQNKKLRSLVRYAFDKSPMYRRLYDGIDLKKFNLSLSKVVLSFLSKIWPEKISVALPCKDKKMSYLHRGTKSLAFRFPPKKSLLSLLKKVGPLVAPSANPEGQKPAATIKEAQKYFSDKVDFYVDGGKINSLPSTLIKIEKDNKISVLREGEITINFID